MKREMIIVIVVLVVVMGIASFVVLRTVSDIKTAPLKAEIATLKNDQQRFTSSVQVLESEVQKWRKAAEPAFGARGINRMNPTPADLERALNPCIPMPGVTRPELCSKLDMQRPVPIRIGLNEDLVRYILER